MSGAGAVLAGAMPAPDRVLEPRRTLLALAATGLALGPRAGPLVWAAVALIVVAALRSAGARLPLLAASATVLVLAGAIGAWRADRLDATALIVPATVHGTATLLEMPRENDAGDGRRALASWRGEPVLLRAAVWPRRARAGTIVAVDGRVTPPDRGARARRAHATLNATGIAATGRRRGGVAGAIDGVRNRAADVLGRGRDEPVGALLTGMVLGQDGGIAADDRADMRAASLTHLTAASGQNVALLAALAAGVGIAVGAGVRARWVLALVLIAVYVPLAGAGPSIVRAAIMGGVTIIAAIAGRPGSRVDALALAAALTLALDPRSVADLGWQLSFAAVVGIALLAGPGTRLLMWARLPRLVAAVVAVTVAATVATAPLLACRTGQSSMLALPANVLVAPAVAPVMWLGMIAAAIGQVSVALATPVAALAAVPTAFVGMVGGTLGRSSLADVAVSPVIVVVACAVVAAVIAVAGRDRGDPARDRDPDARSRRLPIAVATSTVVLVLVLLAAGTLRGDRVPLPVAATMRVTGIAIGQGDATLIEAGGRAILVDTGPPPARRLIGALRRAGIDSLDLLVLTHAQLDHAGAAAELLGRMPVRAILDGRDGVRSELTRTIGVAIAAARPRPRVIVPDAGQRLAVGSLRADVLWPRAGAASPGADPNDRAIVLIVSAYGHRVLMTADAESDVLGRLPLRSVDVLKVSHHGSADAGLPSLLPRLRPRVALIEVGKNTYGHPTPSTLAALAAARIPSVARTDRDGTVRIDLSADAVRIATDSGGR